MSISAIVPVWNGRHLLERLLATIEAQTEPPGELLVVDNGSDDGGPDLARDRGARVIPMGHNAGFAAAVNRGIREASEEWIAVLNSDVELAPDYLAKLRAADAWFATGKILRGAGDAKRPPSPASSSTPSDARGSDQSRDRTGALASKGALVSDAEHGKIDATFSARDATTLANARGSQSGPGEIDATFDATCRGGTTWRVGSGRPDGPMFSSAHEISSTPFTAALFRASLFGRVGFLEETFESYLEDVDFGLRCAAQGLVGRYVPAAIAWHQGSAALGRWHPETVRHIARNQLFLLARHYPRPLAWPVLVAQILWGGVALRHGAGTAWLRGVWQGLRGFSTARQAGRALDPEVLDRLLRHNERIIHEVQSSSGFDAYWKLYFLLCGGAK